ncbi:unnamed protein product, partial [Mesorhabditis belari]|uniref:7TM GPCR serpentine receptor class x (Srx) domain-containing protein n=1 Tax=Mesorhabditis belari TaxID=2138241 RepID=A0AAF3EN07_9BILA
MTDKTINESENTIMILCMFLIGLTGVLLGINGLIVVRKNSFLRGIVRHYLYVDLTNFILINGCHLTWGVPCALWSLDSLSAVNYIFSDIVNGASSMGSLPKLFLGINRILAISFGGRYHDRFERTKWFQYFLMAFWPSCTMTAFAMPDCHAIFVPNGQNFFFVQNTPCALDVMYYTQVLAPYIFLPLSTFFDASVFIMMHRRVRQLTRSRQQMSYQKSDQLRKEYKLAAQMVTNMFSGFTVTFAVAIGQNYISSPMPSFLMWTALWQGCCAVQCLTYVILLREVRPSERKTQPISTVSMQTTIRVD